MPADQAVADEAGAWLAGWEAAGVVELLLQLDSPTTAARAVELFEWLRSLVPDSPQACLCTPATYAAMIGLYGRWGRPKQVSTGWRTVCPLAVQALLPKLHKALQQQPSALHSSTEAVMPAPPCLPALALLPACRQCGCLLSSRSAGRMAPRCTQPWWKPSAGTQAGKGVPQRVLPLLVLVSLLISCLASLAGLASQHQPAADCPTFSASSLLPALPDVCRRAACCACCAGAGSTRWRWTPTATCLPRAWPPLPPPSRQC